MTRAHVFRGVFLLALGVSAGGCASYWRGYEGCRRILDVVDGRGLDTLGLAAQCESRRNPVDPRSPGEIPVTELRPAAAHERG